MFYDPASRAILRYVEKISPSEAPVLLNGQTGTGKELIARHIHALSGRTGPFLAVNCGAINDQLSESELFGHEAGSFTGATSRREGWFEAATGGTLFLDEIGDLPLLLQVKLLRVIQEREVVRIGSRKPVPVDVRLITGTHVDLDHAVVAGHFRQDLLYRINIAQVVLPPLRERPGDVLPLAEHFLQVYSRRMNNVTPSLSAEAEKLLISYEWPGNIRELENVIHFALLVSGDSVIDPQHLKITGGWQTGAFSKETVVDGADRGEVSAFSAEPLQAIRKGLENLFAGAPGSHFADLEELIITTAFNHARFNQVHTAELLGISRNVVRTLLKKYDLIPR